MIITHFNRTRWQRHDVPKWSVSSIRLSANHTADYVESPGKLPALVIDSVREFAKPEYGVDLLKLESPLAANELPARDGGAAATAAQREFDAIGEICTLCNARVISPALIKGYLPPRNRNSGAGISKPSSGGR